MSTPTPAPVRERSTSAHSRASLDRVLGRAVGPNVTATHADGTAIIEALSAAPPPTDRVMFSVTASSAHPGDPVRSWFITDTYADQRAHTADPVDLGRLWADAGAVAMDVLAATDEWAREPGTEPHTTTPLAARIVAVRTALDLPATSAPADPPTVS